MPNPPLRSDYFDEYPPKANNLSAAQVNLMAQRTDQALDLGLAAAAALADRATFAGAETLTNKTLVAPVLSGTVTGTYTLGGTPTLTSPTINAPRVDTIRDLNGANAVNIPAIANASTFFRLEPAPVGSPIVLRPQIPTGGDANAGINILPFGTGRVTVTQLTASFAALTSPRITTGLYDTNGAASLLMSSTASAVNHVQLVNNVAGSAPILRTVGADTDIDFAIAPKGAGRVTITSLTAANPRITGAVYDGNGNAAVALVGVASAVNYVQFQNASAGSGPWVSAAGSDTNVSLSLFSKGVGSVAVRQGDGTNIAMFGATANAVNYVQFNNTVTGAPPILSVQGSDTNAHLQLQPKGNGAIVIWAGTGQTPTFLSAGADANVGMLLKPKGTSPIWMHNGSGQTVFRVDGANTSVVNYVNALGGSAGAPAMLQAAGEANANLNVSPAGTGRVTVTNLTTSGQPIFLDPRLNR
ncbi:hypothetical protein, partial [Mycolicibacterium iranicum]|uniref:hypothetical protein n=1 Tax=Mycolicibacterium iranicum TaxID=912594 RepID=UPI0010427EA5